MKSIDEVLNSAKKFKIGEDLVQRKLSFKINKTIKILSQITIQLLAFAGAFIALKNLGDPLLFKILIGALVVFIVSSLLSAIDEVRLQKQLEEEYSKFINHMNYHGFSQDDLKEATKNLSKEDIANKLNNP
jgi:hypothetical protein